MLPLVRVPWYFRTYDGGIFTFFQFIFQLLFILILILSKTYTDKHSTTAWTGRVPGIKGNLKPISTVYISMDALFDVRVRR
jgi:hypothetical protein